MEMKPGSMRPYAIAGVCGILMVAALYGLPALLGRGGWPGAIGFVALLLPGIQAAHLSWRGTTFAPLKEGALAGLVTSLGASALMIWAFVAGVMQIDWAKYSAQVGAEVANQVQGAIVPVTVIGVALALMICVVGCTLMGWLGALGYISVRNLFGAEHGAVSSQR